MIDMIYKYRNECDDLLIQSIQIGLIRSVQEEKQRLKFIDTERKNFCLPHSVSKCKQESSYCVLTVTKSVCRSTLPSLSLCVRRFRSWSIYLVSRHEQHTPNAGDSAGRHDG